MRARPQADNTALVGDHLRVRDREAPLQVRRRVQPAAGDAIDPAVRPHERGLADLQRLLDAVHRGMRQVDQQALLVAGLDQLLAHRAQATVHRGQRLVVAHR